ncbi:hypothetical protein B296_00047956, partial [Ensete ventricosum]
LRSAILLIPEASWLRTGRTILSANLTPGRHLYPCHYKREKAIENLACFKFTEVLCLVRPEKF